jgi:hypothetical protein
LSGPNLLALMTIVVGIPLNLYVTVKLWRLSRTAPWSRVLRDRAVAATAVLALVIVFGFVFFNNDMQVPLFDRGTSMWISRTAVLALAIGPALYWLRLFRKPR